MRVMILKSMVMHSKRMHHHKSAYSTSKHHYDLGDSRRLEGGVSAEAPEPHSGPFSGRFGSDSGGLLRLYVQLLVCNSDFWPVTLAFGPESESFR